jgi:hypothetical protein
MLIRSWTLFGLESANLDSKSATTHLVFVDWKSDTRKRNVRYEIPSTFKRLDVVSALIGSFSKILLKVLLWPKANKEERKTSKASFWTNRVSPIHYNTIPLLSLVLGLFGFFLLLGFSYWTHSWSCDFHWCFLYFGLFCISVLRNNHLFFKWGSRFHSRTYILNSRGVFNTYSQVCEVSSGQK